MTDAPDAPVVDEAAFNGDRQWFKSRPDRSYRARLATEQEVEQLHSTGAWSPGWAIDPTCFVYAIIKADREPPGRLEAIYITLPPPEPEPDEATLACIWRGASRMPRGAIARRPDNDRRGGNAPG